MASSPDVLFVLPSTEIVARLGAATLVGAVIGLDREIRHKAAGLRTQALVALGAGTSTLVISELAGMVEAYDVGSISRVIQGVLTGIGFLGGGAILRAENDSQIQGLTTAASIWISATLGLACGVGFWRLALVVMALALLVLYGGIGIERWVRRLVEPGNPPPPPR